MKFHTTRTMTLHSTISAVACNYGGPDGSGSGGTGQVADACNHRLYPSLVAT